LFQKLLKAGEDEGSSDDSRSPSTPGRRRHKLSSTSLREDGRSHRGSLHAGLISAPQNDLRHTLHVGYDGLVFGDVSQIGHDNVPRRFDAEGMIVDGFTKCHFSSEYNIMYNSL